MSARRPRGQLVALDGVTVGLIYGRVSSDEQADEGISLDDQLDTNRAYCAAHGIVIGGEYQDVQSGTKATRADYQRMLAEARALKAEKRRPAVIVKYQDRLGRDILEAARAYVELNELGIAVHVAESGGIPSELEYYMRALIAQEESRNIQRKIKSAHRYFREKLWHRPGLVPWGYCLRTATPEEDAAGAPANVLEADPATAPYVREAFERAARGDSIRSVALWVAGLPEVARGGRNLSYATVRKRLRAPVYVGRLGASDEDDPDAILDRPVGHEPRLIDDDVWRQVTAQQRRAEKMPPQASGAFPLTGLLRCPRCGGRMSGRTRVSEGGKRSTRREYLCNASMVLGADHSARTCWMTVPADTIERPIIETITSTLVAAGEPRERQKVLRELTRQTTPPSDDTSALIDGLEAARTKTQARLDTLTNMRADREIDAAQYTRSTTQAIEELDRIHAELKTLRARTPTAVPIGPLDAILGSCSAWERVFATADASAVRDVLGRLLESVSPVRLGRGIYEPNYAWTPTGWLVIQAALVVLAGRRGERARYESLVRVDSLARAQQSTLTMTPATLLA